MSGQDQTVAQERVTAVERVKKWMDLKTVRRWMLDPKIGSTVCQGQFLGLQFTWLNGRWCYSLR